MSDTEQENENSTNQETDVESSQTNEPEVNFLDMSDEEILKMGEPAIPDSTNIDNTNSESTTSDTENNEVKINDDNKDTEENVQESENTDEGAKESSDTENTKDAEDTVEDTQQENIDTTEKTDTNVNTDIDYKSAYEKLTAPFKANDTEISVNSVDEAIKLMMMGANYTKKMQGLAPHLKIVRTLEDNNLLDSNEINYLIDLKNKNPEAIAKLIKDSNIDPLEINTDNSDDYVPNSYEEDDNVTLLKTIDESLRHTKTYNETIDTITNKWDNVSQDAIIKEPTLLKTISDHFENGIYDQVYPEVVKQRMLGELTGVSDIDAYRIVGQQLEAQGLIKVKTPENTLANLVEANTTTTAPKQAADDSEMIQRKKTASNSKGSPRTQVKTNFNPLEMSDEEFEKFAVSNFKI